MGPVHCLDQPDTAGSTTWRITGARCLFPDAEGVADVLIEDGRIGAIDPEQAAGARRLDGSGLVLMPGLVDLHCDAIEKVIEMRPGVRFPLDLAIPQADRLFAGAGITTIFHAISFANGELGLRCSDSAAAIVAALSDWRDRTLVDNRIHCRYELADAESLPAVEDIIDQGRADLVSIMDHTPGQGQFKDEEAYLAFVQKNYHCDRDEALARIAAKKAEAVANRARADRVVGRAVARGLAVASHDDDDPALVGRRAAAGVGIAEFPVTLAAGAAAVAAGQAVCVGSPNIIRGGSQSGSLRAMDAVEQGSADCLCSDYAPHTLLPAIWRIHNELGWPLWRCARLASTRPADAAGFADRGSLTPGARADLIAVAVAGPQPRLRACWSAGRAVSTWGGLAECP